MKKFALILFAGMMLASCNNDDCPADNFVGTYVGTSECSVGLTGLEDDEVSVEKVKDDELNVVFGAQTITVDIKNDCSFEVNETVILGTGIEGSASFSGDQLTVSYRYLVATIIVEDCSFTGTKQ